MTIFGKLCVLMGLALPVVAIAEGVNLFSGFKVEREIILDPANNNSPSQLLAAADGGYFVLESEYVGNGIIKTDNHGQTQWIYHDPVHAGTVVKFKGAAATLDGGVLLCGNRSESGKGNPDILGGVVILLDGTGREVNRIDPALHGFNDKELLAEASGCGNWGDGFFVSGVARLTGSSPSGDRAAHEIATQLKLDGKGAIVWQRKRPASELNTVNISVRSLSNGNLVLESLDDLFLLDPKGDVIKRVSLDGPCVWVNHQNSIDNLQFLCHANESIITTPHIIKLDDEFNKIGDIKYSNFKNSPGNIGLSSVVANPNGSMVIFGSTTGLINPFVPLIVELNANQSVVARYEIHGLNEDGFTAGLPTAIPGEYVAIRPVLLRDKARTAMTFLRRH